MLAKLGLEIINQYVSPVEPNITTETSSDVDKEHIRGVDYRQAVGCLLWIANGTRPDISYAVSQVSRFLKKPGLKHWQAVKKIVRYLVGSMELKIRYNQSADGPRVTQGSFSGTLPASSNAAYVDTDFASCKETRRSVTGFVFMLACGPVSWNSRKQPSVALSTTEAQYMAAAAVQEIVWLK